MMKPLEWRKADGACVWRAGSHSHPAAHYRIAATLDGGFAVWTSSQNLEAYVGSAPFNSFHEAKAACAAAEESLAAFKLRDAARLMLEASVDGTCEDADTRSAAAVLRAALALFTTADQ